MRIFLYRYALGFVLVFIASCQSKVTPGPLEAKMDIPSLSSLFSQLEERQSGIFNLKAFIRTKISSGRLNQTFRQALLIRGNDSIRLETFNLFRQVQGVLIHDGNKTLMYDPTENLVVYGDEVLDIIHRVLGIQVDFREYISLFLGGIPRFSHLQAKILNWNAEQTVYRVETIDKDTGEAVNIEVDANTLFPKSMLLIRGTQEIYRVSWEDYRRVDQWNFAHKLVIEFLTKNEAITINYSDLFINKNLNPDAFKFVSELVN